MNTALDLRLMALVLQQGRRLDALSRGLLLVAAFALLFCALGIAWPDLSACIAFGCSVAFGFVQTYCAARVAFDAGILAALAGLDIDGDAAAARLDASLHALGLRAASGSTRSWPSRWAGARRWLLRQGAAFALQLLALLAGGAVSLLRMQ